MKSINKSLILLFSILFFVACESHVEIAVQCVDAQSNEPIEGVAVSVNAGMDGDYTKSTDSGITDSNGWYKTDIMIGCPGKCYDIYITYEKDGYDLRKDLNVTDGVVKLHSTSWSE
ncbi:MAG: hypothetical protein IPH24_01755 [Crocinitomicaceae bacterium]|nr:hypothetical protein [Crocinitomicaceae bacterium]